MCVFYVGVAPQVGGPVVTLCTDKGPRLSLRPLLYRSFPAPTEGNYTRPETAMREGDVSGSTGGNTPREGQGSGVPGLEVSSCVWGGGGWWGMCGGGCGVGVMCVCDVHEVCACLSLCDVLMVCRVCGRGGICVSVCMCVWCVFVWCVRGVCV